METIRSMVMVLLALVAPFAVPTAWADDVLPPARPAAKALDVELYDGNLFFGQMVDSSGQGLARVPVSIRREQREIGITETDAQGYFYIRGLRGGTYHVVAGEAQGVYRAWAPHTAPPAAKPGALLVAGESVNRGQQGPLAPWLQNPGVVSAVMATADAVPVATDHGHLTRPRPPVSP